jgi:outer membrane protein TolC
LEAGGSLDLGTDLKLVKKNDSDVNKRTTNSATATLEWTQALLKNLIWNKDRTSRFQSCVETKASYYSSLQSISTEIVSAATIYLEALQISEVIPYYIYGEKELKHLLDDLETLPINKKTLKKTRHKFKARIKSYQASQYKLLRKLNSTLQKLQQAMGVHELFDTNLYCLEDIPDFDYYFEDEKYHEYAEELRNLAIHKNFDALSAMYTQDSSIYGLKLAQNQVRPKLDAISSVYVTNELKGVKGKALFRPYDFNQSLLNGSIAFSFSIPICNSDALGGLESDSAKVREKQISLNKAQNKAITNGTTALNNFRLNQAEEKANEDSAKFYEEVFEQAKKDLHKKGSKNTFSWVDRNLKDLISTKEDLSTSRLEKRLNLLDLRLAISQILSVDEALDSVSITDLMTFPFKD